MRGSVSKGAPSFYGRMSTAVSERAQALPAARNPLGTSETRIEEHACLKTYERFAALPQAGSSVRLVAPPPLLRKIIRITGLADQLPVHRADQAGHVQVA